MDREAAPQTVEVEIDSLANEGWGVGRVDGRVLFVPDACPGDRAEVAVEVDRGAYAFGRIRRLLRGGPGRRIPPCPVAGECGGCQWQHVEERVQREQKMMIFADLLRRVGGCAPGAVRMCPPRGPALGYRRRVRIVIHPDGPAFRRRGSGESVRVEGCPAAIPPLDGLLAAWAKAPPAWFGAWAFREAEITWMASIGAFQVNLLTGGSPPAQKTRFEGIQDGVCLFYSIDNRWLGGKAPGGIRNPEAYTYAIPEGVSGTRASLSMKTGPGEFHQVNDAENATLIETVTALASPAAGERGVDLYCGVGNFTLPLALRGMRMMGIDSSEGCIRRARFNAQKNGVVGCEFRVERAEKALSEHRGAAGSTGQSVDVDLLLLDPPRTGCKRIIDGAARLNPGRIVYVSCNPATLARDVRRFGERGYLLAESRLVDVFPQTYHIESVNLLRRKKDSADDDSKR